MNTGRDIAIGFLLAVMLHTAGCYVIAPMYKPTFAAGGTQQGFSMAGAYPSVPGVYPELAAGPAAPFTKVLDLNVAWYKHIWRFFLRNAKWMIPLAFAIWLAGWTGMLWLWRRSSHAFKQVVASAEHLKEEVQTHIPKSKSNDILASRQDNWVSSMVDKAKNKIKKI